MDEVFLCESCQCFYDVKVREQVKCGTLMVNICLQCESEIKSTSDAIEAEYGNKS